MNKVILTRDQAEVIEHLKEDLNLKDLLLRDRNMHWAFPHFHQMSNEKLEKALYTGYEVKPTLKVGDWVYRMLDKKVYRVEFVTEEGLVLDDENLWMFNEQGIDFKNYTQAEDVRHATLEEASIEKCRRWWNRHGRGVWELRKGDILINPKDEEDISIVIGFDADGLLKLHSLIGDYINRIPINEVNYDRFRVLCFVEKRLDVKNDE